MPVLQTTIVEVEAVLNDRPLTYFSTTAGDPEPLTPSHLLCGHRIVHLPHPMRDEELTDPDYCQSANQLRTKVDRQGYLLQHFQSRWKREYLTALREVHRTTGTNQQHIRIGDVVQIHDDSPRSQWKLAVIKDLVKGNDGYIRSVTVRTANGITNRPITRLYPLEVSADECSSNVNIEKSARLEPANDTETTPPRPTRGAMIQARNKLAKWTEMLRRPPEDVEDDDD